MRGMILGPELLSQRAFAAGLEWFSQRGRQYYEIWGVCVSRIQRSVVLDWIELLTISETFAVMLVGVL